MDTSYQRVVRHVLVVAMALAAMAQCAMRVDAVTHPGDIEALKEVKRALNASSIRVSTCLFAWNFTLDPCDARIPCIDCATASDPRGGNLSRVTGLRLERNAGYQGPLSPAIGNLTALQHLIVSNNALDGAIPASLANCTDLFQLDLSQNFFTGAIPAALGHLSSLAFLSLAYNALSDAVPPSVGNLHNLTYLYLNDNQLAGPLPDLSTLASLSVFDASGNNFTGPLPPVPSSLSLLALRRNQLTGHLPPSLKNLTLLQVLDLRENLFLGTVPAFLYALPSLQQLNLSHNHFTALDPFLEGPGSEVLSMDVSHNEIQGTLPPSLAGMQKLTVLALRSNMLTGPIPLPYALKAANAFNGTQLGQLYLDDNYLSGEIPSPLLNVSADMVSANLVSNCLDSCPPQLFFCSGGTQKTPIECHVPVVIQGDA